MVDEDRWAQVDRYVDDLFVGADPVLESALRACERAGLPEIQVTPSQGKLLFVLASAMRARRVLEMGTLGGYSTIWLARALPADGALVTIEIDPGYAAVARANLAAAGLAVPVDLRVGPALGVLSRIAEDADPFDLIFIDADKESYPEYLPWAIRLARAGSLIIADNVVRDGEVADEGSVDPKVQGVRRFNAMVAADPRVTATVIQTVGAKGYDGFAAVLVKTDPSES